MSDIDWSKAPKGCLGAVQRREETNDYPHGIFVTITEGYMEDGYHYCGHKNIGPCMEYYDFIVKPDTFDAAFPDGFDDMTHKPVYTQAMADNGDLPLVGMEVMSMGVNKIVRLPPDTNRRFLLESVVMGIYDLALIEGISAIKPPIELIGGNPYMFNYGEDKETFLGFFNKNDFNVAGVLYNSKLATNIQLLEVK